MLSRRKKQVSRRVWGQWVGDGELRLSSAIVNGAWQMSDVSAEPHGGGVSGQQHTLDRVAQELETKCHGRISVDVRRRRMCERRSFHFLGGGNVRLIKVGLVNLGRRWAWPRQCLIRLRQVPSLPCRPKLFLLYIY